MIYIDIQGNDAVVVVMKVTFLTSTFQFKYQPGILN